jgi:NitT/TauT family transport system permease protein
MRKATQVRIAVLLAAAAALEILCRVGIIKPYSMIPPTQMLVSLVNLFTTSGAVADMKQTLTAVVIALTSALIVGFVLGAVLHAVPRLRRIVDPLLATYYSVPIFVFYPVFIVAFGLNAIPKTVIGFLYALVAVVINTLNGLDRVPVVLWKTAKAHQLGRVSTAIHIVFPCAAPYLFTGVKLAIAYAFIGVIGSEFILSSGGLGYRISFAYNNFQTDVMYGLMLFVLSVVITVNMALYVWERRLMKRRGER